MLHLWLKLSQIFHKSQETDLQGFWAHILCHYRDYDMVFSDGYQQILLNLTQVISTLPDIVL